MFITVTQKAVDFRLNFAGRGDWITRCGGDDVASTLLV